MRQRWIAIATACAAAALPLLAGAGSAHALTACAPAQKCPVAHDDSYSTTVGAPLVIGAPGLLANDQGGGDTQIDTGDTDTSTWLGATVAVRADGSFTYTPDPRSPSTGIDNFTYYIQDSSGHWDVATANIDVRPVVRDDLYSTAENTRLTVNKPGIFANDVGIDVGSLDADDTTANGGDVAVNNDGSFAYTPPKNFKNIDTFTYTVSDTNGDNTYTSIVRIAVGTATPTPNTKPVPANTTTTRPGSSGGSGASTTTAPGGSSANGGSSSTTRAGATSSTTAGRNGASTTTPGAAKPGEGSSGGAQAASARASHSDSTPVWPIVLGVVAVLVLGTGAALLWRRRSVAAGPGDSGPAS